MKWSTLNSLLHTDVRTLLYRLCFALCPSRACWPTPDHREIHAEYSPPGRGAGEEPDPFQFWSTCVLWGNGVFWSPKWRRSATTGERDRQALGPTLTGDKNRRLRRE